MPKRSKKVLQVPQKDIAKASKAMEDVGISFFFKQWGGFNKKKTGRIGLTLEPSCVLIG
jgi:protein gp37